MVFLFNKKVPDELPDLKIGDISKKKDIAIEQRKDSLPQIQYKDPQASSIPLPPPSPSYEEKRFKPLPTDNFASFPPIPQENKQKIPSYEITTNSQYKENINDQGFFANIIKDLTQESNNIDKLDQWYNNKFLPGDLVNQMREYWENQSPEVVFNSLGGELKKELMDKTNQLSNLEREWQEIYFKLMSKEEEIRNEEKDLKETLAKLIKIYKRSSKNKK